MTRDQAAACPTPELQRVYDELTEECRHDLALLNDKLALKELIRRELHGRIGRPVR